MTSPHAAPWNGFSMRDASQVSHVERALGNVRQCEEIEEAVRATLDSPTVNVAVAPGRYWREVYVAVPPPLLPALNPRGARPMC
jgi:hypothetical protein